MGKRHDNHVDVPQDLTGDIVVPLPAYAKPEGDWDAISCLFGSAAFPPGGWLVYMVGGEV
ncbi:hypothetical protein VPNG_00877 [Cytospora leucostoma]|uniref:Uncharacterized protein n=1 Tax=Cytospora leucostoma TaxID=1230097 RepID=A0A423XME2_9PEZI|nr:hypothetical protein VPNG_00877 [Cytospora leucostoma]